MQNNKKLLTVKIRQRLFLLMEEQKRDGKIANYTYFVESLINNYFKSNGYETY